jgi:hypothetical protein
MGLNNKQEEKLAEILSNTGTVIFTVVIAGQFFPEVYFGGINRIFVMVGGVIGAVAFWMASIYLLSD